MRALILVFALGGFVFAADALGQAPQTERDAGITPNGAIGEVKAIDATTKQLIIKTDAGSLVSVTLGEKTIYMRLAPGAKDLTNATTVAFTDVGEGDRVWARGRVGDDQRSVPNATALIIMTKADITKKQEEERAEWRRRGILGEIRALDAEKKEITISTRTMTGMQAVVIPVTENVEMRRYAPDSIRFADAKSGSFDELKVGDQLRALGERNAEENRFVPEKIVTGSFQTVAGKVSAINAESGEITIEDLQNKQSLTVVIKQDAVLRKFPPPGEMGAVMMRGPGGSAAAGGAQGRGQREGAVRQAPGGPGGGGMRMAGGGGFNIQEMLERLPIISVAEVQPGDTIIVSSTKGADPSRLTAITLVSGAETLLNMMAARQSQQAGGQVANPSAGLGSGIPQFGIGLP
ncbi:MAG TPA: hypothetical protein VMM84_18325 [Pyrinomonadaceae bacterium]|nr:hypothetical protein [Pyrinomonadaceae bacterium]